MSLRPAVRADLPELLRWRNDVVTRYFRPNIRIIEPDEHERWFSRMGTASLLYIYEHKGCPAGNIEFDFDGDKVELGWIIKPSLRGFGLGKRMVNEALDIRCPCWCKMRWDNTASYGLAVACGFRLVRLDNDMLVLEHE